VIRTSSALLELVCEEEGGSAQALIFNVILLLDRAGKDHGLGGGDCHQKTGSVIAVV
jgi:hypothetical protein